MRSLMIFGFQPRPEALVEFSQVFRRRKHQALFKITLDAGEKPLMGAPHKRFYAEFPIMRSSAAQVHF
jgi:hypothetical protein